LNSRATVYETVLSPYKFNALQANRLIQTQVRVRISQFTPNFVAFRATDEGSAMVEPALDVLRERLKGPSSYLGMGALGDGIQHPRDSTRI
jgi:hypothetical protein